MLIIEKIDEAICSSERCGNMLLDVIKNFDEGFDMEKIKVATLNFSNDILEIVNSIKSSSPDCEATVEMSPVFITSKFISDYLHDYLCTTQCQDKGYTFMFLYTLTTRCKVHLESMRATMQEAST